MNLTASDIPISDQIDPEQTSFDAELEKLGAEYVNIGIFDRNAVFRHKRVSRKKASKLADTGYPFCDVLYHWDTAEEVYSDGVFEDKPAALDTSSLRRWPIVKNEALCIADFYGDFGEHSARNQLKKQLARAAEMGFCVHSAFEFEFNLFDETAHTIREKGFNNLTHFAPANRTYSLRTAYEHGELLNLFIQQLGLLGIDVEAIHTELGPGCFEVPLQHADGIKSADDAALFKNFAKAFFAQHGLTACFMSKVLDHLPGQSGHLHLSLTESKTDKPIFHDEQAEDGISDTARHFIGGVIDVLPQWIALCSHTTNAYRRLQPGAWAPTHACWGVQNRTSALRIINGSPKETRIEFRVPSADTNPFTALACLLAAGLNGIEEKKSPNEKRTDNCYTGNAPAKYVFPRDLGAAADHLELSKSARATFGNPFIDNFVEACRFEDVAARTHVSAWERQRYLEVV